MLPPMCLLWALSQLTGMFASLLTHPLFTSPYTHTAGKPPQELRLSAALRQPSPSLTQLDFELLTDHRMLRVVKSMIQARSSS